MLLPSDGGGALGGHREEEPILSGRGRQGNLLGRSGGHCGGVLRGRAGRCGRWRLVGGLGRNKQESLLSSPSQQE